MLLGPCCGCAEAWKLGLQEWVVLAMRITLQSQFLLFKAFSYCFLASRMCSSLCVLLSVFFLLIFCSFLFCSFTTTLVWQLTAPRPIEKRSVFYNLPYWLCTVPSEFKVTIKCLCWEFRVPLADLWTQMLQVTRQGLKCRCCIIWALWEDLLAVFVLVLKCTYPVAFLNYSKHLHLVALSQSEWMSRTTWCAAAL